jgi:thiol:disulfide interchange protein DsbC
MKLGGSLLLVSVFAVTCAQAGGSAALTREEIIERHPELRLEDIKDGPVDGLYEINVNGMISYISHDGRFQLRGDVIDLDARRNLTEARRAEYRASLLAAIDPSTQIIFKPTGVVRHTITVFTDVDCGYCRQLHRDIDTLMAFGVEVHYVSYPRTGPNTESWFKAERVWCSPDRNAAITNAKLGAEIPPSADCGSTPIAAHYALGRSVGVSGTPAIYASTGEEIGGYLPPQALLEQLEKLAEAH